MRKPTDPGSQNREGRGMYKLGRFLQFVGLFIMLPAAIAGNMLERIDVKEMLLLAGTGVGVFYVGWLIQQSSRSP